MSVNKLKNIWVSNDTTYLQGTYNKVSILNEGKTELKGDTLINTKLAINKNIDSVNDYKLDVSGDINFNGNLYKNNAIFSSGISLADVQGNANTFTNANTFNNSTTFSGDIIQTNKNIIQKVDVSSATTYNWTFGSPQIIILTASNISPPTINFNLPIITSTTQLGTMIYIKLTTNILKLNAPTDYVFADETNISSTTKNYSSSSQGNMLCLLATNTTILQWTV
jgi:hypothetical protein